MEKMKMDNLFANYPDVVTVSQLQEMLQIGRNTAYRLVATGKVKSIQIGNKYKIPKCFVIDYLKFEMTN